MTWFSDWTTTLGYLKVGTSIPVKESYLWVFLPTPVLSVCLTNNIIQSLIFFFWCQTSKICAFKSIRRIRKDEYRTIFLGKSLQLMYIPLLKLKNKILYDLPDSSEILMSPESENLRVILSYALYCWWPLTRCALFLYVICLIGLWRI